MLRANSIVSSATRSTRAPFKKALQCNTVETLRIGNQLTHTSNQTFGNITRIQNRLYARRNEEPKVLPEIPEPFENINNVELEDPEGDKDAPMPYFTNFPKFEESVTKNPQLDEDTGEMLQPEDNEALDFAVKAVNGQVSPADFFTQVNPNHLWSTLRGLPKENLEALADDVRYHVMPDWLFMDEADFVLPEGDPSIWGPEIEAKTPLEKKWVDLIWYMSERDADPLNEEKDRFVKEWRANFVPKAVQRRMWELHKMDQYFWNYDRLARTFAVKRHIVKAVCLVKEEEEAIDNGLPFDERKNLKLFKWERRADRAIAERPWKVKQISQEEAYREYIKAISKPETLGDAEALPLFKGALKKKAKKAAADIKQLRDVESKSELGVMAPRSQYVFVEVGRNVEENKRRWVVREMDGTLRTASREEQQFVINQYPSKRLGRKKYK